MSFKSRRYLWLLLSGLCVIAACKPNSADLPAAQPATGNIAYFNLIPRGSAINLYLNGTRQNSNKIAYNEYSGYISTTSGDRSLVFKTDSLRNNLFDPLDIKLAADYTTIFVSGATSSDLIFVRDTAVIDSKNYMPKLRFVNAAPNSPAYNVTLNSVTISNTAYKGISAFARVDTGRVVAVKVRSAGSSTVVLDRSLTLLQNKVYTLFIYGSGNGLNLGVIANR